MATLVDPDDLRLSSQSAGATPDGEVFIKASNTTIQLCSSAEFASSNFDAAEGVSLQALYSFLKEEWKNNDTDQFYRYRFPMEAITAEQFEFINGWKPADDTTRTYIRTGGWAEKDTAGAVERSYMGVITLGNIESDQTVYYGWYSTAGSDFVSQSAVNFNFNGPVNEAVQIFGDSSNGNFDYRSNHNLFVYIRPTPSGSFPNVTGYTYDQSSTDAIGTRDSVTNQVYRFPLATQVDLKITKNDTESASVKTATGLRLRFDQTSLSSGQLPVQLGGGTTYSYTHLIDSTSGDSANLSTTDIYNVVQYLLRQDQGTNINEDGSTSSRLGVFTEEVVQFVGDQLQTITIGDTPLSTSTDDEGVLIDNFDQNNTANLALDDNTNTLRTFPRISSGTLTFSPTLQDDASTRYWMFYTSACSGNSPWPGDNALVVDDNSGNDIAGYYHVQSGNLASSQSSGTVSASGSNILVTTGSSYSVNSLSGYILRVTTGNNIGFYNVASNTASTITITGDGFENPDSSSVAYQVYDKNTGTISWTFDYDGNANRNDGSSSSDAAITIVALGLDNAQYITTTGTIGSGANQNFTITAPLERNYNDPL